ncbi:hypothetical protein Mapa_003473 [Marchantia paleacea]|nr:hypothetical protein Mapa_003473 [Marchantia paleacea]
MAARKLHMPGARERLGGGGAGAGAVAEGVVQNGNGVCVQPPGESRYESRLAPPIMQPLPLASRYVGVKHDSQRPASSALQSSWIQRLRPASPDVPCGELGHEVAHVWRDPQPALWSSSAPLLLAGPSKEPFHQPVHRAEQHQQQGDDGGDEPLTVREVGGAPKALMKNIESVDKGKGRGQVQGQTAHDVAMAAGQRKNDTSRTAQPPKAKPLGCSKGFVPVEGCSSKRQGMDSAQETNHGMVMPPAQKPHSNGAFGPLVTGFGPLRVVLKPPAANNMNKSLGAGNSFKLKGPVMEGPQEMDAPPPNSHLMAAPDRTRVVPYAGPQVMMPWAPGTSIHPSRNILPDPNLEIDYLHQIGRSGELFGGGFYPMQRGGYISDYCGPQAPGQDMMFTYPGRLMGNRSAAGFVPVVEDHAMAHRVQGWYPASTAMPSGVDRAGRSMAPTHSYGTIMAKEGRFDSGLQQEGTYHTRTNPDPGGKHVYVANGTEARKAKEVVVEEKSHADVGHPQQQASHMSQPFAPYQSSPSRVSFGKQPFLVPPARSPSHRVEEDAHTGEEGGDASQERPEQTSLLTPLFGPRKPQLDETDGKAAKPPWSSLFAVYKLPNQLAEPPNSNSSTGTLPLDGRLRVDEGQNPGNPVSGGPRASGNQDNESGGSARTGARVPASSAEARSVFDNQSSHFSSSPWPVDDGHNPTDDARSAIHSQTSHTPSSQAPNALHASNAHSKGQEISTYKCDAGGSSIGVSKDVSYKRARSIEPSGSLSPGLRNSSGAMEGSRGPRYPNEDEDYYERGPVKTSRPPPVPSFSGQKDDTSGSSPPSLPMGCNNSSDLCSPAFPGVEDRGKSRGVHLRAANLDNESVGMHLGKRQQGMTSAPPGLVPRRRERSEPHGQNKLDIRRDPRESGARPGRDVESQEAQPMVGEAFRELGSKMVRPNETGDFGQKQSRLRNPSDVVGEAGTSGPSKRSRHHPNQNSWDFQVEGSGVQPREQENGAGPEKPSSWLSRWLPVGSKWNGPGPVSNSPTSARPKEGHGNGQAPGYVANGQTNYGLGTSGDGRGQENRAGGHVRRMDGNGSDPRINMRDLSSKRAVFGLPPFPTPSAAAMALVGTAARKLGPLPSQRKGPIAMWPSVHLETTQTPEAQKSVRSSELPTYVEQS